jgi:hypothetical protein
LKHINKKGRPVSQCQHCRSLRKARSAHVKCDCGEKTHKCVHLTGVSEGHKESCCCNHGGRCTCSHKKELSLDTVPETDSEKESPPKVSRVGVRNRRRAHTIHHDGALTLDENGHHKPTYKHAKPSQRCGPYQLSRVNSLHGSGSLANRSADDLLYSATSFADGGRISPISTGSAPPDQRQTRSETASPHLMSSSAFPQPNGSLPPLDLSGIEFPQYIPNALDFFGSLSEQEQPLFSAALSATSVDWSNFEGLEFASKNSENFTPSNFSQPQSFGGMEFSGSEQLPTLTTTTSNSAEVSEAEELFPSAAETLNLRAGLRNSTASSDFGLSQTQANLLAGADINGLGFEEFKLLKDSGKFLPSPSATATTAQNPSGIAATSAPSAAALSLLDEEPAFWMPDMDGVSAMPETSDTSMPSIWDMQ